MQSDWLLKQQRFERTKMSGKKSWKIFNFQAEKFRPGMENGLSSARFIKRTMSDRGESRIDFCFMAHELCLFNL